MSRRCRHRRFAVLAAAAATALSVTGHANAARPTPLQPVVVAIAGESGGINVLHQDFRTSDGRNPTYPAGMPRPVMIALPRSADFAQAHAQLAAGALGHLRPGVLYAVSGTRLLLLDAGTTPYNAAASDALHGTGVVDSVVGTRYGTDPDALGLVVLSNQADTVYPWLADQSWVDLATTSDYVIRTTSGPTQCNDAAPVRHYTAAGHLLFSSAGNTTDQPEPLIAPNGMPETYLVGGVDAAGNTWHPGHLEESDPSWAAGNVVRPYETGELYSYPAAAPDSFAGTAHFGGTSGATPRTAGWAASLVAYARQALGSASAPAAGTLASGPRHPTRGPLADGRLTNSELRQLLHAVATQHSGLPPGLAYALEGYGALNANSIKLAKQVLDGTAQEPARGSDDQADALARQARSALFSRCS